MKKVGLFNAIRLKNIRLQKKLFLMSLVPLALMGVIIVSIYSNTYIKSSIERTRQDLCAVAATTVASYEQKTGKYFYNTVSKDLWKGQYNISKSNSFLGGIKGRINKDITVIDKKGIVITTAVTNKGEQLEYVLNEDVKQMFFEGREVFTDALLVNGREQYIYGIPLFQEKSDEVVGAVVVSVDKKEQLQVVYDAMKTVIIVCIVLIIIAAILILVVTNNVTGGFKLGFAMLERLSNGKLNVQIKDEQLARKDEIGDMYRSIHNLYSNLRNIISGNIKMTDNIGVNVRELDNTAKAAKNSVDIIDNAVEMMNDAAYKQSSIATRVAQDIDVLGKMIESTYADIQGLNESNSELKKSNNTANKVVDELSLIKQVLNEVIEVTSIQTKDTYKLTKEISNYVQMIIEFAEETNLLALNATIEAARVGEKGKGFAIVANQIQTLADQSNIVSNDISRTVKLLLEDSKESVNTMERVNDIVDKLNNNIEETKKIFDVVHESVDNSLEDLKKIEKQAVIMDETKESITCVVKELDDVIQANQKSVAGTAEVTGYITELFSQTKNIKNASDELIESIKVFEL